MATDPNPGPGKDLMAQVQHYGRVLLKWKWTAFSFFVIVVSAITLYSFLITPSYTSKGTIWIEDESNILPFEDIQRVDPSSTLSSHSLLLKSRTLAAETIEKLQLYKHPDFPGNITKAKKAVDPADPIYRARLVELFLRSLGVDQRQGARLVDVRFSNHDPKLAVEILTALFTGYLDMIVKKKYMASEQATEFLNTQIATLRTDIEASEKKLNEYGSQKDIMPLTATEAPMVTRLAEVNRQLTDATIDRINKGNYYNQIKSAPLGEVPGAPAGSLIERLREQYLTLSREYATLSATLQPEYPEMKRRKSELDAATSALQAETQNLIRGAYTDYQSALGKELSLKQLLEVQKNAAYSANSNSVVYNQLRIELDNKKTLLEALSRRKSETDVSAQLKGLEAVNVWIVDKPSYPLEPSFPNKRRNVLIGLLLGVIGGAALAMGIEYLNHTVKTSSDVTKSTGLATLGTIPSFDKEIAAKGPASEFSRLFGLLRGKDRAKEDKPRRLKEERGAGRTTGLALDPGGQTAPAHRIELITSRDPRSIQAESYRSIRTTLFVSFTPGKVKAILFTSPLAKEGKSTTVSNLGVTLAEANKNVVIVDADLRRPRQSRFFSTDEGPGLTRYLSSGIEPADIIRPTQIPNLSLITTGPLPASPIELLTSERMDILVAFLKRNFDYILLDTPPLLAVSDALALGPMADGTVLICRGGQTPLTAMKQAKQKLDAHRLKCLGVILNGVDLVEQDGYYARQYYQYTNSQ
jgi:capsular exopolysaccharide synthesis family protein